MRKVWGPVLGLTALCAAAATVRADDPAYDKVFMDRAYAAGLAGIAEAKLALDKTGNGNVLKFAQRLINDRGAANDELAQVAKAEGQALPTVPTDAQQAEIARLTKLAGNDFDQAYLNDQVTAGEATVALYLGENKSGQDPVVKEVAARALPILNDHVQMAKALAEAR